MAGPQWLPLISVVAFWALVAILRHKRKGSGVRSPLPQHSRHTQRRCSEIDYGFGYIRWTTTALNRSITYLAAGSPRYNAFLCLWFQTGVVVGSLSMIIGIMILLAAGWSLLRVFIWEQISPQNVAVESQSGNYRFQTGINDPTAGFTQPDSWVVPLIPGFNLPLAQTAYYFLALAVSGVVHELGHAIAATNEHVAVHSFGVFFYGIYPGAFVNFDDSSLARLAPRRKLRVICAGAWHNIVVALLSLIIMLAIPYLMSLGYVDLHKGFLHNSGKTVNGVTILDVHKDSPLYGQIRPGSIITQVNDIPLLGGLPSWENTFSLLSKDASHGGLCMRSNDIDTKLSPCCKTETVPGTCFVPLATMLGKLNSTTDGVGEKHDALIDQGIPNTCTSARQALQGGQFCSSDESCGKASVCMTPLLYTRNDYFIGLYILESPFADEFKLQTVAYMGDVQGLWGAIKVGKLFPRMSLLPLMLPYHMETLLHHFLSLSLALGILNMVPAWYMDGEWALVALVELIYPAAAKGNMRNAINAFMAAMTIWMGLVVVGSLLRVVWQ